jgi:hypothetical protein
MSMLIETKKKIYELFEEGVPIPGVVVGWKKLENVPTKFGPKTKVMVKILTDLIDKDGDRMTAIASFNASLNEKSDLRKFVKSLLGFDCGETYDLEQTIGLNRAFVFVTNTSKDGRQFSNIDAVLKTTTKVNIPKDYVAFKSDEEQAGAAFLPWL